jgi:RNA polymerase sigma-70 factor (ECF subfamily)
MGGRAQVALVERSIFEWAIAVSPARRESASGTLDRAAARVEPSSSVVLESASDADLVEAFLAGRQAAFDVIVERHRRTVYQLCYRFVGNHEDASDLAQDVFIRAYRGLARFKGQSALGTWLYRIGVNACLNRVTTTRPPAEPLELDRYPVLDRCDPVETMISRERGARVRAAIARLPRKQRLTLILRVYQELPHQQIADILGSSVGAVKANFFHALGNLRKLLAGEET